MLDSAVVPSLYVGDVIIIVPDCVGDYFGKLIRFDFFDVLKNGES